MRYRHLFFTIIALLAIACLPGITAVSAQAGPDLTGAKGAAQMVPTGDLVEHGWNTVVNNNFAIPNGTRNFSSYGQPSVNKYGTVVFRARSTMGGHETGIYIREYPKGNIRPLADLKTLVPEPNNLGTMFREFSSFPRIAINSEYSAFRGLHAPVYRYFLPDNTETRAGTTGIYATLGSDFPVSGATKLGIAPGFEFYSVPVWPTPIDPLAFDVFPGGSAINDDGAIVFKGNWTENDTNHKTGIFARRLINGPFGGFEVIQMLASSDTEIPNAPPSVADAFSAMTFDSTSPPSVAGEDVVFLGLDFEDDPHYGGIYRVSIKGGPLEPLVEIGKPLPNTKTTELIRIGEGLSFDGRYLGFWAAWGDRFKTVRLNCPVDGNKNLIDYCNGIDPRSIFDRDTRQWYQLHQVPIQQGIVVMDLQTKMFWIVSNTDENFNDFVYWTYSGKAPGDDGDEDSEPPRWRAASFMAVSDGMIVFKARTGMLNDKHEYINVTDGLYMVDAIGAGTLTMLAETGMDGSLLDPSLAPGAMPVTGVGIERDGFRGQHLAINATMANAEAGWGGIYMNRMERVPTVNVEPPASIRRDGLKKK